MARPSKIFAILAAVSLALCVTTIALWCGAGPRTWSGTSLRTQAITSTRPYATAYGNSLALGILFPYSRRPPTIRPSHSFGYLNGIFALPPRNGVMLVGALQAVVAPFWFVATVTLILPAWFIIATIRYRRRTLPGHCPTCGYDLRATPDRCPECGTEIRKEEGLRTEC